MKYLINSVCKFEPLFNVDFNNKKNIVSCSFFKLATTPYKNFNLYVDGLERLYKKVYNEYADSGFVIRLFIDNSIKDDEKIYKRIKKMNKLEIVIFYCANYLSEHNKLYHEGLFGTIVRFFPMFDFEYNDANIVIISDIDDYKYFVKCLETIQIINSTIRPDTKLYFVKSGNITKNVFYTIDSFYKNIPNPYAIAPNYISYNKCDHKVIYNFLDQVQNSDEVFSKYVQELKLNPNKNTGKKFVYGIDEYLLNINYTNYLIDTNKVIGIKFKWSVYGSLYWFLNLKNISPEHLKLINVMLDKIIKNSGIKTNVHDVRDKFRLIDKLIGKNVSISEKILYEYYKFFLECEKSNEYEFLFEKKIYKIIREYNLFGIYDYELMAYCSIENNKNDNTNYHKILFEKKFTNAYLEKLYEFSNKNFTKLNKKLFRNQPTAKQDKTFEIISLLDKYNIGCDIDFANKKNLSTINKFAYVSEFVFDNVPVIIKREINSPYKNQTEYDFYMTYSDKIINSSLSKFIIIPIKMLKCTKTKPHCQLFVYEKLDWDYNNDIIRQLNFKEWIRYTIILCLTLYWLNNHLKIYHNDLCFLNNIRNIMVKKNTSNFSIQVDKYNYIIDSLNYPIVIDFDQADSVPKLRTYKFYVNKYKKNSTLEYKYFSEVFIIYYYSFKIYFGFDDYWDEKYDYLYSSIQSKVSSQKEFDCAIIDFLFELEKRNF